MTFVWFVGCVTIMGFTGEVVVVVTVVMTEDFGFIPLGKGLPNPLIPLKILFSVAVILQVS